MGHKFYRMVGGVDKYYLALCQLMERKGHQVIPFATKSESNLSSPFESYFAPHIQYQDGPILTKLVNASRFISSSDAKKQIAKLVADTKPEIAHLQHIYHQLTTSIFEPLRNAGIPIVQGIHDYKLGCPRYMLFNTNTNKICDACEGEEYFHAILSRCYDGSLLHSAMIAIESYYNRINKTYQRNVARFLVSNNHMKEHLVRYGIKGEKIVIIPNFVDVSSHEPVYQHDGYLLYFGRLSIEKGIEYLIRAMHELQDQKLLVVGNGPDEMRLRQLTDKLNLENVSFLGSLWGDSLQSILDHAMCVIVPSYWHENSPMVIYESFASGKPVIGSRRGGIPDLIDHGVNGLLFDAGDVTELKQCIQTIATDPAKQKYYGLQARLKAEKEFSPDIHYARIVQVYRDLGMNI